MSRNRKRNREKRLQALAQQNPKHPFATESRPNGSPDPLPLDFNQDPLSPSPPRGQGDARDITDNQYSDSPNELGRPDQGGNWGQRPKEDGDDTPRRGHYRQLILQAQDEWGNLYQIRQALKQLEFGMFRMPAQLADAMMKDERISACTDTLINGLLALPKEFKPDEGKENDEKAAEACAEFKKHFPKLFPQEELARTFFFGLYLGVGLGEKIWSNIEDPKESDPDADIENPAGSNDPEVTWTFRLKAWHLMYAYWNPGTHRYQLSVDPTGANEELATDTTLLVIPEAGDDHWAVFHPYGGSEGWFSALIRSLAVPYMVRQFAVRDWARFSEVYGTPARGAVVPEWASAEQREAFVQQIQNLNNEPVVELPARNKDEATFDFKIVQAAASEGGTTGFSKLLEYVDQSIAVRILGQNLTTSSGRVGSQALGKIHENVKADYITRWAQALEEFIHEQFSVPWAIYKYGDASLAPWVRFNADPPADLKSKSEVLLNVSNALKNLSTVQGADIDANGVLDEYNIPRINADDDGGATEPQPLTPRVAAPAPGATKAPNEGSGEPPPRPAGTTPSDPPSPDGAGLTGLALEHVRRPLPAAQQWIDRLTAKGAAQFAALSAGDLRELKHAIQESTSFEDLRARVLETYRDLPAPQTDALLEVALSLAHWAGAAAVTKG